MSPKALPSLRRHRPTSQGVVTLTGRDHYLGNWPDGLRHPPEAVRRQYDGLIAEWLANGRRPLEHHAQSLLIESLMLQFWERHVLVHFRDPDGCPTAEQENFRLSLRPLRRLFGHIPAGEFSPLKLKAIRESMITAGLARGVINQRIGRIKRLFKWGVSEELVNEAVYRALESVDGLKCGRTTARETEPVKPVDDAVVDATLPHLPRRVQGMIRIQRYSSLRPGEVARLRGCDLDRSGEIWLYKPARHKTAWRGKARVVPIGPRCQEVLQEFLKDDPERFLFSPREVREERFAALRAARKTRVPPSQLCRRKRNPKRQPRDFFTTNAYAALVAKACVKAGVPHWHPNQLRHSRATEVRAAYGLEAAQVILGHARANVTEVYAERNLALAAQVAAHSG